MKRTTEVNFVYFYNSLMEGVVFFVVVKMGYLI